MFKKVFVLKNNKGLVGQELFCTVKVQRDKTTKCKLKSDSILGGKYIYI